MILLADEYHPIADEHYLRDHSVGARMNGDAIRAALQIALERRRAMFHVHLHDHHGRPGFSRVDVQEHRRFVPDFFNVAPTLPHGALVLSHDAAVGTACVDDAPTFVPIDEIVVVGLPMAFTWWRR